MTAKIPPLTATQMRDIDAIAEEEFHFGLLQMMENAGSNLAQLALERFAPSTCPKRGLLSAPQFVGELWLADVSIPRAAYERVGVRVPELFAGDTLVQLDPADVD